MGLIYQLPKSESEKEYVIKTVDSITFKSYGLPKIFWFYFFSFLILYLPLVSLSWSILIELKKYYFYTAYLIQCFLCFLPLGILFFFYYEKILTLKNTQLHIKDSVLFFSKNTYKTLQGCILRRFLDSPNLAKIKNYDQSFQNKGYFILEGFNDKEVFFIDRSSQAHDLLSLVALMQNHNKELVLKNLVQEH